LARPAALALGIALVCAVVIPPAQASPPPTLRGSRMPGSLQGRASALPVRESGPARVCGTRLEAALDLIGDRLGRDLAVPQPTAYSTDTAGIAVMEDDGTFFYGGPGGRSVLDVASVAQAFRRTHGDDYDALAIYLSSGLSTWLGSATALAAAYMVRNDVRG